MKIYASFLLVLLFTLLLSWSVQAQAISQPPSYTKENLLRLEVIFNQQLKIVQNLEKRISNLQSDLEKSRSLLKSDTKKLNDLRIQYLSLKTQYEKEKKLLKNYQIDLLELREIRQRLENSLREAETSLDRYSQKVLGDKIIWGLSGAAIGAAAATVTILILSR